LTALEIPMTQNCPKHTDAYDGRDLGDEFLFYNREGDKLHVLNGTAREIYLLCDGHKPTEQIATTIADRYDVEQTVALDDTREAIQELINLGLLE
jgi:hypothetical protein